VTDARLALIRELERADEEVGVMLAELDELYAATEEVRKRALELEAFAARLPAAQAAAASALEETGLEANAARETAGQAAGELHAAEEAGDPERLAAARRFHVRARDSLAMAERRVEEAAQDARRLEDEAAAAEREVPAVEARAVELAAALSHRPRLAAEAGTRPGSGLPGVSDWAGRARAALLVARNSLAAERDAVIRQANELGSLVLGEPLAPVVTADVARRVERKLGER
jgi:small-conductance mechanosensitive channel